MNSSTKVPAHPEKVQPMSRLAVSYGKRHHFPSSYLSPSPHDSPCPRFSLPICPFNVITLSLYPYTYCQDHDFPSSLNTLLSIHVPWKYLRILPSFSASQETYFLLILTDNMDITASPCPCLVGTFIHTSLSDQGIIHAGIVVYAYNPRTWKTKTGESRVHHHPQLHNRLKNQPRLHDTLSQTKHK